MDFLIEAIIFRIVFPYKPLVKDLDLKPVTHKSDADMTEKAALVN